MNIITKKIDNTKENISSDLNWNEFKSKFPITEINSFKIKSYIICTPFYKIGAIFWISQLTNKKVIADVLIISIGWVEIHWTDPWPWIVTKSGILISINKNSITLSVKEISLSNIPKVKLKNISPII